MCNFTKGPWKVVTDCTGAPVVVAMSKYDDSYEDMSEFSPTVCDIRGATYSPNKGDAFSDAYLIASSPEMYEALERIVELLAKEESYTLEWLEMHTGSLTELLAKARGEHA